MPQGRFFWCCVSPPPPQGQLLCVWIPLLGTYLSLHFATVPKEMENRLLVMETSFLKPRPHPRPTQGIMGVTGHLITGAAVSQL